FDQVKAAVAQNSSRNMGAERSCIEGTADAGNILRHKAGRQYETVVFAAKPGKIRHGKVKIKTEFPVSGSFRFQILTAPVKPRKSKPVHAEFHRTDSESAYLQRIKHSQFKLIPRKFREFQTGGRQAYLSNRQFPMVQRRHLQRCIQ